MSDDRRTYSDEEFALVLRKAAELAETPDGRTTPSNGLTLSEMKAAAAQAGFDPTLVERAARLLSTRSSAPMSVVERLIGGRLRHGQEAHFPITLDEAEAARLLSALQIEIARPGTGHSSAMGLAWHSSDDVDVVRVTARSDPDGTSIAVDLDRRGTLAVTGTVTLVSSLTAWIVMVVVGNEVSPALGAAVGATGLGGALAVARGYWSSSSRKAREQVERVMDSVSRFLSAPRTAAPPEAGETTGTEGGI